MKNVFNRLTSALLALCMVVAVCTVIFTSTVHVGAEETEGDTEVIRGD